jgi:hypothetical protein
MRPRALHTLGSSLLRTSRPIVLRPRARFRSTESNTPPKQTWKWYNPLSLDPTSPVDWLLVTGGFASGYLFHDWYNSCGFFSKKKVVRVTINLGD